MTTASIATSFVACFIQLICLMSRPMRTMLRVTKHGKKKCVLLFGMNRIKHRKKHNKCENFLLVWEFCGEPGEVWEFKKNVRFLNWCWNSYASGFAYIYKGYPALCSASSSGTWEWRNGWWKTFVVVYVQPKMEVLICVVTRCCGWWLMQFDGVSHKIIIRRQSSASFLCESGNPKLIHEGTPVHEVQLRTWLVSATFWDTKITAPTGHTMSQRPVTCCFPHASSL